MSKSVLDIGNCAPDHEAMSRFLVHNFDCQIDLAHGATDAFALLRSGEYALVLINRKLDQDGSAGIEILKQIKADATLAHLPVMLITNYPEHQETAIAAGAQRGFGKLELGQKETIAKLHEVLGATDL